MDTAARALGLDPAEIRRRNLIPADRVPVPDDHRPGLRLRRLPAGARPRAGGRRLCGAAPQQEARRARGEIVGVGLVSYVEPCALGWESGSLKVERSGKVTAITGSSAHGQGHETTFAQVVADTSA